jgi:hypothetical protein
VVFHSRTAPGDFVAKVLPSVEKASACTAVAATLLPEEVNVTVKTDDRPGTFESR